MGAGVGASVSRVSRGPCRRRAGTPTAARISGITPGGLFCWYAVLSLNHIGHAMEESLWSLLMLMMSAIAGTAALAADGSLRAMLIACFLIYGVGAGLTMAFDVRMYVRRWRLRTDDPRLTLATGWHDSRSRRHQTIAWEVWREEVPWMTLYFSIGVWTSLAMVLL